MDNRRLKRFVKLELEKRGLQEKIDKVKETLTALEEVLIEDFMKAGAQNINIDGYTIYIHRQLWANAADGNKELVCTLLKEVGMGDLVKEQYSSTSLSAYVRELEKNSEEIPEPLKEMLSVAEVFHIRMRRRIT